jgi:hypothetical protein
MYIFSSQYNMIYVIKLVLWLVVISLISTQLTANIPLLYHFVVLRIAIAAGELNNLFMIVGDISSAYLEAFTLEKFVL